MTEAIYYILSNNAAVSAIVGTRIYPIRIPLGVAYPAISYQVISDVPENTKTGRAKYYNCRLQINCFAADSEGSAGAKQSLTLSRAVKAALERITPGTYGGITIINSTFLIEMDDIDDTSDYDGVFYKVMEFNICHGVTS